MRLSRSQLALGRGVHPVRHPIVLSVMAGARLIIAAALLGLAGCAATPPLPQTQPTLVAELPLTLHVTRQQADQRSDWLLIVQPEPAIGADALRWTLFDPLGVPLARQQLRDGRWHNDGLLPPNAEARPLFAALLFALTPEPALAASYGDQQWSLHDNGARRLAPDWLLSYRGPLHITLERAGGLRYRIAPLTEPPLPESP